jgi:hypothetical protein
MDETPKFILTRMSWAKAYGHLKTDMILWFDEIGTLIR